MVNVKKVRGTKQDKYSQYLFNVAKLSNEGLLEEVGLAKYGEWKSRKSRISKFGNNVVIRRRFNWFYVLMEQFIHPFNILMLSLIILDLLTYFVIKKGQNETSDLISAGVSFSILTITIVTALLQGYRTFKVEQQTGSALTNHFTILKKEIEDINNIHIEDLQQYYENIAYAKITVGDLILLRPGDIVPADMRVLWENNFSIDDSFIRGKNLRVEKVSAYTKAEMVYDLKNIVLSQSIVTDGYALCLVVGIGKKRISSYFSKNVEAESKSFYHRGLNRITKYVMLSTVLVFPISFITVYFSGHMGTGTHLLEDFLYSITIVVSIIPESLPAVIVFNLQHGNKYLKNEKVIVKNVEAVQDLGGVDIFMSNKNGPIAKDRPILTNWFDMDQEKSDRVINLAYINAHFQPSIHYHFEQALLDAFESKHEIAEEYKLINTSIKKNRSQKNGTVVIEKDEVTYQVTVTSLDNISEFLKYYYQKEEFKILEEEDLNKIILLNHELIVKGYRPLVVASKILTDDEHINNEDLMFEGLIVFKDQLRDDIHEAVLMFKKYNIDFKVMSGDSLDIVKHTAEEIGIGDLNTLIGDEISSIPKEELNVLLRGVNVFAKLSPIQKSLIIHTYTKSNHVVAYLGDGASDILAIKKADVGVVPSSSTPLAKKFADIIVLDKSLNNFDNAISWGRITFLNTLKFIKLAIATNLGLFFSLLFSELFFPFFPLTTTQLLLQNLFIDFAYFAFMADSVSKRSVSKSIKWNTLSIVHFVIINSLTQFFISVINILIISYGLGWYHFGIEESLVDKEKIQTTYCLETIITRVVMMLVLRTDRVMLWKDLPRWKFLVVMLAVIAASILMVYIPGLNSYLEMEAPDPVWWPIMFSMIVLTILCGSFVKWVYRSTFKMWF